MYHARPPGFIPDWDTALGKWYQRAAPFGITVCALGNYDMSVAQSALEIRRAAAHQVICQQLSTVNCTLAAIENSVHVEPAFTADGKWRGTIRGRPCAADGTILPSRCRRRQKGTLHEVSVDEFFSPPIDELHPLPVVTPPYTAVQPRTVLPRKFAGKGTRAPRTP
jgi:hypothetical protein